MNKLTPTRLTRVAGLLLTLILTLTLSSCMSKDPNPTVSIDTTLGAIEVEIFQNEAPEMAKNFLTLAKEGKYDGVPFHRVIKDFMIQTGDFTNRDGTGGYSYLGQGKDLKGEYGGGSNLRGTLSYANRGPDTNGSQFFINTKDNTFLDFDKEPLTSKHPVFGKVIKGMEVVDAIGNVTTLPGDKPEKEVLMKTLTIK